MFNFKILALIVISFTILTSCDDTEEITVETSIINHEFKPNKIIVEAGKKIRLIIHNEDNTTEEFDSIDLKREKIIPGNATASIILAPLKPGEYNFVGEFHEETAKGCIVVIESFSEKDND